MTGSITTLPISPVERPHLGLCFMPFVMDMLGEGLGLQKILSLNIRGLKYSLYDPQAEKIRIAQSYISHLEMVGIQPNGIWRDDLNEFAVFAQETLMDFMVRGILKIERRTVLRCPCGKVEYLKGASNYSDKRRLFTEQGSKKICKLCLGALSERRMRVCLFTIRASRREIVAIPSSANTMLKHLMASFNGVDYLVSKARVTHFSLNMPNLEEFDIDPDFVWSLMIPHLYSKNLGPHLLISSWKNMLASMTLASVAEAMGMQETIFVFPPYLTAPRRENVKSLGEIQEVVGRYGKEAVRSLLLSSLGWKSTESVARPEYLHYLGSIDPAILRQVEGTVLPRHVSEITKTDGLHFSQSLNRLKER